MKLSEINQAPHKTYGISRHKWNINDAKIHRPIDDNGNVDVQRSALESLEGAPMIVKGFFCCSGNQLESLDFAPTEVHSDFYCDTNKIKSLHMIHKQIKVINGQFIAYKNPLESNLLGLILIDGIKAIIIDNKEIQTIMKKHLGQSNKKVAMLQCQQELIEAGFEEAAQL